MNNGLWLGIDLGTQGVRTVLADTSGRVVGEGRAAFGHRTDPVGAMTHDPVADWTACTLGAIHAAIREVDRAQIAGVGACGLFPALACLDKAGQPVGDAVLYGDGRAKGYVRKVETSLGASLTGDEVSPRLLWLRETQPAEFGRAAMVVGPTGFVTHLLTGRAVIDPHSAFRWGGLVDAARAGWSNAATAALNIDPGLLPEIVAPHEWVGSVTPAAASATGLAVGTPVIGGTTDSFATLVGHGAVRTGDTVVYYGSSWTVLAVTADLEEILDDPRRIDSDVPWQLAAYAIDSGRFIERLRLSMFGGRSYDELDALAAAVPAGARGVVVIPSPTGRFDGRRITPSSGAVLGFGLEHTPGDLWRAALESLGYIAAQGLERIETPVQRVVAAGGGAGSATWRGIVDELTGVRQRHHPQASAALGAAFLTAYGLGGVTSLDPISEGWLSERSSAPAAPEAHQTHRHAAERRAWRIYEGALAGGTEAEPLG